MRRLIIVAVAALLPTGAYAISDQEACEANGGTFSKVNGQSSCSLQTGNSSNTKTTTQQGSFESSQPTTYTNPGGSQPAGQQGKVEGPR